MKVRRIVAVAMTTATAAAMAAGPAAAQPQSGLVNVDIANNTVQVPISVAANVCGVQAGVLATGLASAPYQCTSSSSGTATVTPSTGTGGGGPQQGLVNLAITGNTIQVPVGLAANLCQIQAGVLASEMVQGAGTCKATSGGSAVG